MKSLYIILFISTLLSFDIYAHELSSDEYPLEKILETYSEIHGIKFVQDPRVRAIVTSSGVEIEEISQVALVRILLMHDFTALEKNGVVYVLPRVSADTLGKDFGTAWVK